MLFPSLEFIIFAAVFFAGWPLLRKRNATRWIYLTAASFIFYGWWDWRFLFLILGSGLIDYFAALGMVRWPHRKKLCLILSICGNLGSLGIFKYLDFAIGNMNGLMHIFGITTSIPMTNLILPVGISFYTFQSMSYTFDVYRDRFTPTRNVFHFFAYLSMFPQLVAGPIVRGAYLLPQLEHANPTTEKQRWDGLQLIAYGLFKKVVVADTVALTIDAAYGTNVPVESAAYWWIVVLMFNVQVYCDFSGYSDIARGLAHWMGYDFPLNFDHPFIATSIRELWSRWHISLGSWFRDYMYFPLGGSRGSEFATHRNLWITMLVCGLWHGASWSYVIWCGSFALLMSIERLTDWPKKLCSLPGGRHVSVVLTVCLFGYVCVFFRAASISQALSVHRIMLDVTRLNLGMALDLFDGKPLFLMALIMARHAYFHFGMEKWQWNESPTLAVLRPVYVSILLVASAFFRGPGASFVYFQF